MTEQVKWEYKLVSVPTDNFTETSLSNKRAIYKDVVEYRNDDPAQGLMIALGRLRWNLQSTLEVDEDRIVFIFKRPQEERRSEV